MITLACIADDLTGASDLAGNLARAGMSVIQVNGVPAPDFELPPAQAVVVALKSRTIAPEDAIRQSLEALAWLQARGAARFYFKYCSTFDSTAQGNIGPVTDALAQALDCALVPASPAYPRNQRTVYQGHLFVGNQLLSETGMRDHPLTPMTDANLVRVLAAQTPGTVGLIASDVVEGGAEAIWRRFEALRAEGTRHAIVDIVRDADLTATGEAFADLPLATGGTGLAIGIARAVIKTDNATAGAWVRPQTTERIAWLSGSCSQATRRQVARARKLIPGIAIDPLAIAADGKILEAVVSAALDQVVGGYAFVYATAEPEEVAAAQRALGAERAALLVENAFRVVARALADAGVRVFVVAGGETSGAVVDALDIRALAIGPEIDPGVPWTRAVSDPPMWLALKSGNFGGDDFFAHASEIL